MGALFSLLWFAFFAAPDTIARKAGADKAVRPGSAAIDLELEAGDRHC
jgi:hypothetical protein